MYAYLGHDEDNAVSWFNMRDWRLYKTTDAANWTDLGVTASLSTFAWARADAWASQVIERNGKFYYYTTLRLEGEPCGIGVAVADKPEGPFKDAAGKPLASAVGYIDPTVFIDDDGQAYLYFGNPDLHVAKLNPDMISLNGGVTKLTKPSCYTEAPWVYKRNGTYNIVYATNCNPGNEDIRHATSPTPTGPWTYRGTVQPVLNGGKPTSWTNHPGIVEFKGKQYYFYHTGDLSGSAFRRSVQVEEFAYKADGTIPDIPVTKTGPKQIENLNPYDTVQAETIAWAQGLKTFKAADGRIYVDSVNSGDYIKVKGVDFGAGATSFSARVASGGNGGSIELGLDALTGTVVGTGAGVLDRAARDVRLRATASSFEIEFDRPLRGERIAVEVYRVSGRREAVLFDGPVSSSRLTLPSRAVAASKGVRVLRVRGAEGVLLERTVVLD